MHGPADEACGFGVDGVGHAEVDLRLQEVRDGVEDVVVDAAALDRRADLREVLRGGDDAEAGLAVAADHLHQRLGDDGVRLVDQQADAWPGRLVHADLAVELGVDHVDEEVDEDRRAVLAEDVGARVDDQDVVRLDHRPQRQPRWMADEVAHRRVRRDERTELVRRRLQPVLEAREVVARERRQLVEQHLGGVAQAGDLLAGAPGGLMPRVRLGAGAAIASVGGESVGRREHLVQHLERAAEPVLLGVRAGLAVALVVLEPGDRHRADDGAFDDVLRGLKDLVLEQIHQRVDDHSGDADELVREPRERPAGLDVQWRESEGGLGEIEVPDALGAVAPQLRGVIEVALGQVGRDHPQQPLGERPLHVQDDRRGVRRQHVALDELLQRRALPRPLPAGDDHALLAVLVRQRPAHPRRRDPDVDHRIGAARRQHRSPSACVAVAIYASSPMTSPTRTSSSSAGTSMLVLKPRACCSGVGGIDRPRC